MEHFKRLALYNRLANEKLFEVCGALDDAEYRKARKGSFGGIAALLNHILLGDQIWMSRFEGGGGTTPPLDTTLFENFNELKAGRAEMDRRIESFFENLDPGLAGKTLRYLNSRGEKSETRARISGCAHV